MNLTVITVIASAAALILSIWGSGLRQDRHLDQIFARFDRENDARWKALDDKFKTLAERLDDRFRALEGRLDKVDRELAAIFAKGVQR